MLDDHEGKDDHEDQDGVALLAALIAGDHAAWTRIFYEMRGTLRAAAARVLAECRRPCADISDVFQVSMIKAYEKRASFQGKTLPKFEAWLTQIVNNQAISDMRHEIAQEKVEEDKARRTPEAPSLSGKSSLRWRRLDLFFAALYRLPAAQCEAVRLMKLEAWPMARIETRLGRSREAIYGLVKRGMLEIKRIVGEGESTT